MSYRELLQALEQEVVRRSEELRSEALAERERLLDATRSQLAARRAELLADERRRLEEESRRALARARLEERRALLGEERRALDELRREAEAGLATLNEPGLLARLVDELVPELDEGPLAFRVEKGDAERLREHLGRRHPGLLPRATIAGDLDARGGVEVSLAGRLRIDNTLASRLRNAWQLLETEIAERLLATGDGDGGQ